MDEFIPVIIIGVIIISSIMGKIKEAKEEAERQRRTESRRVRAQDLPESAQRQLYGKGADIPVAHAKGAPPMPPPRRVAEPRMAQPAQQPRRLQPQREKHIPPMPDNRTVKMPERTVMPTPSLRERAQTMRDKLEHAFEEVAEQADLIQNPARVERKPPARPQRPSAQQRQARKAQAQQQARQAQQQKAEQQRQRQAAQQKQARARRAAAPRRQPATARTLFTSMNDVRRGIVLSEILGPPKSMQ